MQRDRRRPAHAIIIGGSVVGSAAAALLARRFERVTILERDTLPSRPGPRPGVPQSRHVHVLLARGAAELERIFSGFVAELAASGAEVLDIGRDIAWHTRAGWGVQFESRVMLCCATRDLIEWHVRRRALQQPNVTLIAFMASLQSSIIADILEHAMPVTAISAHRRTENRWRHFDEVADWPEGLVAMGDSLCCFDPVYGQGMTTGILSALSLADCFDAWWTGSVPRAGFSSRVQRTLANIVRPAWNLATSEDLRLPSTTGGQLRFRDRMLHRYVDSVSAAATVDPKVRGPSCRP